MIDGGGLAAEREGFNEGGLARNAGDGFGGVIRPGVLFLAGRADFLDQFGGALNVGNQLFQLLTGFFRYAQRGARELVDLRRRLLAALGELPNLGGYRPEAAPLKLKATAVKVSNRFIMVPIGSWQVL